MEARFAPLPVLRAPLHDDEVVGVAALARHGAELFGRRDPGAVLQTGRACASRATARSSGVELPLPHAEPHGLEVTKRRRRARIATGAQRRSVQLPRPLARASLATARLAAGMLVVRFEPGGAA